MATDIWTTVRWMKEASDRGVDLGSGAEITRLTGSALHTYNNYSPQCFSADGKRCLGVRVADMLVDGSFALLAHDLETKYTVLLDAHSTTCEFILRAPADAGGHTRTGNSHHATI